MHFVIVVVGVSPVGARPEDADGEIPDLRDGLPLPPPPYHPSFVEKGTGCSESSRALMANF
jgi:hypothetical protein